MPCGLTSSQCPRAGSANTAILPTQAQGPHSAAFPFESRQEGSAHSNLANEQWGFNKNLWLLVCGCLYHEPMATDRVFFLPLFIHSSLMKWFTHSFLHVMLFPHLFFIPAVA